MAQILSIKQVRDKIADIVSGVEQNGEEVVITKFGKPRAIIVPISKTKAANLGRFDEVFGIWKDRDNIAESGKWVKDVKTVMSLRKKDE